MIIAGPEWFGIRKYGGWGISIKTWQGAYIAGVPCSHPVNTPLAQNKD